MKVVDILIALACGWLVNWIAFDFLKVSGYDFDFYRWLLGWVLPALALLGLWISGLVGRKFPFLHQAAKFLLIGAGATVVDIKVFNFSVWIFSFLAITEIYTFKAASFLIATFVKYWGNKYWAFEKNGNDGIHKEVIQFFLITAIGLAIDVLAFYYFTKVLGPQFNAPAKVWQELSIIFAALAAAIWNFCGYKFFVFKK